MIISEASRENIDRAAWIIKSGGIVAFPTETVYGLGADALNPEAISRIFEAKERPFFDPLIVHITDLDWMEEIAADVPDKAEKLISGFWPGPLTVVLKKTQTVPDIVTAGLDTVAIRMPLHQVARKIIRAAGRPVAAPSANPFGYVSPTRAEHVLKQLDDRVDMIIDGGSCAVGVESTIIKIDDRDRVFLLRHGGIGIEEIEALVGAVQQDYHNDTVEGPGQLPYHYSPSTPVKVVRDLSQLNISDGNYGFIYYKKRRDCPRDDRVAFMSRDGDLRECASNLFSILHRLDSLGLDCIYAEEVPEAGLGRAIMDRLRKAEARSNYIEGG